MTFKIISLPSADPLHSNYNSKINEHGALMTYYESKAELLNKLHHRFFYELLNSSNQEGVLPGFTLPILYNHMEEVPDIKEKYKHLIKDLQDAAHIIVLPPDQRKTHILNLLKKKNTLLLPFGFKGHAMLLKLRFDDGLYAEVYNSGEGLDNHKKHPNLEQKFQTCRTYFQKNMQLNTNEFHNFLEEYLKYPEHDVYKTYSLFSILSGWDIIRTDSPFQSIQKAGNCALECAMAFLKKNMAPEDYLYYRIRLIQDVHTQISQINSHARVLPSLEKMLKNRAAKSINLAVKSLQTTSYAPYTALFNRLSSEPYFQFLHHNTNFLQTIWNASENLPDNLQVKCLIDSVNVALEHNRCVKQVPQEALEKLVDHFQNRTWDTMHESEKIFLTKILDCDSNKLNIFALTFFSKNLNILNDENNKILEKLSSCIQKNYDPNSFNADNDFHSLIATLSSSNNRQVSAQAKLILSELGYTLAINKKLANNITFFNAYKTLFLEHISHAFPTTTDPISENLKNTVVCYNYKNSATINALRNMRGANKFPSLYSYFIGSVIKTAHAEIDAPQVLQQDLLFYYGHLCQKQHYAKMNLVKPFLEVRQCKLKSEI